MFLNGSFELDNKKAIAVPESAVVRYQSKPYIFIAKDSTRFEMVEVEIGISDRQMIELKAKENTDWRQQKVVLKNAYSLLGKLKNKMEDD